MDWTPLSLQHKPAIEKTFYLSPIRLSTYTFTNLWMWNDYRQYQIAYIDGFLCIKFDDEGKQKYLYPMGHGDLFSTIKLLAEQSKAPFFMRGIPEDGYEKIKSFPGKLTPEEEHFDYIYSYQDLLELAGNRYQAKRNLIHQFENHYQFQYHPISTELIPHIIDMETQWFKDHLPATETMLQEHQGALKVLNDLDQLNILGGALLVDNQVAAYTIAEYMSSEMLVIHIEKALPSYKGAYPMINQQFLQNISNVNFVNREEDLGILNLAKVKDSYHPIFLNKSYRLEAKL
jgi:hypothetical protein